MSKEKRMFLIRSMLIAMLLTMLACVGAAQALTEPAGAAPQDGEQTPVWISLELDGYLLEFEDLLPLSIQYEPIEETPRADMLFTVDLQAAIAEGEATAAAVRAAQIAAEGILREDEIKQTEVSSKEPAEAAQETSDEPETEQEEPPRTPIFTMILDEDVADWVVLLTDDTGSILPVAFEMAQTPDGLDEKQAQAFTLAQGEVQVLLATLVLHAVPGEENTEQAAQEGSLQTEEYELSFGAGVTDMLSIRKTESGCFEFYMDIAGEDVVIYTLDVGSEAGDIVMMLADEQGAKIPAAILMAACPESLEGDDKMNFYKAQGTVATIMSTLSLKAQ